MLQANCRFRHHPNNHSNSKVQDVNGMLSQVPWAKHKDARSRWNHTIIDDIPKQHVLPVVLVRDPYFWMQSMCKEGYGARWSHSPKHHCPNLVPNEYDRRRFARLRNATSTTVWMGENQRVGPNWPSLIHYWNDWYRSYVSEADFPRLIIRFEDTLYHGEEVMRQVCECAGAEPLKPFTYLVDNAKSDHKQAKNDFAAAVLKYGNEDGRYRNMTSDDLTFARLNVDKELLRMFHYKLPDSRLEQQREVDEGKRQRQRH
uniref:Sulfotransferase domain-containing protein n=1 Tax=Craspedostauros australis TaxID=1486917 RepID=A0A7R9ZLF0_9STRA